MRPTSEREAAAQLARRIEPFLIDPSKSDESNRPPSDRPPGFADALMSERPVSLERAAHVSLADWELIVTALEHYASCTR
jgi:hypothetical protein